MTSSTRDRAVLFGWIGVAVVLVVAGISYLVSRPSDLELTGEPIPSTAAPLTPTTTVGGPDVSTTQGADSDVVPSSVPQQQPDDGDTPQGPTGDAADQIESIIAFVEQERGLEFKETPIVQVLADVAFVAQYQALVDRAFEEQAEEFAIYEEIYWAFGFLDLDVSLYEIETAFGDAGVVGFYDQESDELFVRSQDGGLSPYVRGVVAHELVHALDDQHFELFRPHYDDADDEIGFGLSALAEGNANRIGELYEATFSAQEAAQAQQEALTAGGDVDFSIFRTSYLELVFAPYQEGQPFVDVILDDGGQRALDEAFDDPPVTSEAILHPERYLAGETYTFVTPPPADDEVLEDGLVGELALRAMFSEVMSGTNARRAADGWAGDWFVIWHDGDQACVRADIEMDDASNADELRSALVLVAAQLPEASVRAVDDLTTRFTSCVQ